MATKKAATPDCPPDILVSRALEGDINPKYAAKILRDWLKFRLNEIAHRAHKHEVQYWLNCPGTDDEKLGQILGSTREMLSLIDDADAEAEGR